MHYLVRPATASDLDQLYTLAMKSSFGLTNLPKDRDLLARMLKQEGLYIFLLERQDDHQLIGTSMIRAKCPIDIPLPYFIRYPERHFDLLHLTFEKEGISELCGLYIDPEARKAGLGNLLSLSRLLFIADHLHRFTPKLFAEIRGFVEADGSCPFWDGMMRPFFNLSFKDAVNLYIKDLGTFNSKLPSFPIYYELLPKETRKTIGVLHPKSVPALNMLEREGFEITPLIHPLDGGPRIEGYVGTLHGIRESNVYTIKAIRNHETAPQYLIATTGRSFLSTIGPLVIENGEAVIDQATANLLQLGVSDQCRTLPLR